MVNIILADKYMGYKLVAKKNYSLTCEMKATYFSIGQYYRFF